MSVEGIDTPELRRCNKRELARILDCSLPTIQALIERYPDMPVIQRGDVGREWIFDPEAVIAYLQQKREEAAELAARRDELLGQFSLPLYGEDEVQGITPAMRLSAVRAAKLEDELAVHRRSLLVASEVRETLRDGIRAVSNMLNQLPRRVSVELNLPDGAERAIKRIIDDARHRFVESQRKLIDDEAAE